MAMHCAPRRKHPGCAPKWSLLWLMVPTRLGATGFHVVPIVILAFQLGSTGCEVEHLAVLVIAPLSAASSADATVRRCFGLLSQKDQLNGSGTP
jgi:hypothetical protein